MSTPLVEARAISKRFGGVRALVDASVVVEPGAVHALIGENGAGKSTLGRILGGVETPDGGELLVDGASVRFTSPRDAMRFGIATISQEVALVPARTVLENVLLGVEPARFGFVRPQAVRSRFEALTRDSGFALEPDAEVRSLRPADQRKVEIVRALARGARLIVMDEPTASLGRDDRRLLDETIRRLAVAGTATVLVSHDLREVLDLAETVTVLRNGRVVRSRAARDETTSTLITGMLGRPREAAFPPRRPPADDAAIALETRALARRGVFEDVSVQVARGELVGLVGTAGSGHSEFLRALFGADRADAGQILVDGAPVGVRGPRDAARHGIVFLPERRVEQGLVMMRPVRENLSLVALRAVSTGGIVRPRREGALVGGLATQLDIRAPSFDAPVSTLSGGNQQKTVLAKWLARQPKVLLADEPTRGVDIGAKLQIHQLLADLAVRGLAVLFIASDVEEAVGLAHRLLVFRDGRVVDEVEGARARGESVMASVFGESAA